MAAAMKAYLQRYVGSAESSGAESDKTARSKKKKRLHRGGGAGAGSGVVLVDDDAAWQKEAKPGDDDDDPERDEDGEGPTVIEDVEVKRMQRMEATKSHRPYLSMADDGSGWVTVREDGSGRTASGSDALPPLRSAAAANSSASPRSSLPRTAILKHLSPPRRSKPPGGAPARASPDLSPPRRAASADLSPPRRSKASTVPSARASPARRAALEDLSPPRRSKATRGGSPRASPDLSPPRRAALEDLTPPRRSKASTGASARATPPRRAALEESSLPRRSQAYMGASARAAPTQTTVGSSDASLARRRHDSASISPGALLRTGNSAEAPSGRNWRQDSSPPRRARDLSPPRRRHDSPDTARTASALADDLSPPRRSRVSMEGRKAASYNSRPRNGRESSRKRQHDSREMGVVADVGDGGSESWYPRRKAEAIDGGEPDDHRSSSKRRASTDVAVARRAEGKYSSSSGASRDRQRRSPSAKMSQDGSPVQQRNVSGKMADGAVAGLDRDGVRESEAERRRVAEAKALLDMDPSVSGRGATTVFRDKRGRRVEGPEALRQQKDAAKAPEVPLEWGKGLAQKKLADAEFAKLQAEKNKPFARYEDDVELDQSLRERVRFGDPMAHLVKKKISLPVLEDLGASEEMKASGFMVPQDIPKHSWLKGSLAPPPNRYDIRPGRHWDGVDRSTGYEQNLFKQKNEKRARDLEAYLWSVSDM